jgi:hypothetical protein
MKRSRIVGKRGYDDYEILRGQVNDSMLFAKLFVTGEKKIKIIKTFNFMS